MEGFFWVVIGALLSLGITILIEYQRRPKLYFAIEEPPLDKTFAIGPARNTRFLRVQLWNRALPKWLRWLNREVALHCNGQIQFHHFDDGAPVHSRAMPIRWAGADEPITSHVVDGKLALLFDPSKYSAAHRRNCFTGNKETIDVVARFDDDEDCYGWSNDSYLQDKGWRNPDWKLPRGRYLVAVTVYSAGEKLVGVFKLENSVGRSDFRLLPGSAQDRRKLGY